MHALLLALALVAAPGDADHPWAVVSNIKYDPTARISSENVMDVHGWDGQPAAATDRPAVIYLHSGGFYSGNATLAAPPSTSPLFEKLLALPEAPVVFDVMYPLVDLGVGDENYLTCVEGAARAVQYIRAHAAEFGVDPERVVIVGKSAGTHIGLRLSLGPDYADTDSAVTEWQQSSRPNHMVGFPIATAWHCLDFDAYPMDGHLLGTRKLKTASDWELIEASAIYWLFRYERDWTPSLALIYKPSGTMTFPPPPPLGCGEFNNVHHDDFGPLLMEAIARYGDPDVTANSELIEPEGGSVDAIVAWTGAHIAP